MTAAILEHNVSVAAIANAKGLILAHLTRLQTALSQALPWLTPSEAAWAAQASAHYVAGLWPAAHPSPAAAEVLAPPGIRGS